MNVPNPRQIDWREWHTLFRAIPDELVQNTRYYRHLPDVEWSLYLFPPSTHTVYGNRLLRKLRFDNSPAALRLWGFVLSECERLYRAKQAGMKVVAVMGDLGAVTPLIYSFPNTIAFYPDCLWWTPFLMESRVLFEEAAMLGLSEDCCYVRAALGGFARRAYFPRPDLCIATVGATCDDMAAVTAGVERLGCTVRYLELPHRADREKSLQQCYPPFNSPPQSGGEKDNSSQSGGEKDGSPRRGGEKNNRSQIGRDEKYHPRDELRSYIAGQHLKLCGWLEDLTGAKFNLNRYSATIHKVNHLRKTIADLKDLITTSGPNPMGALEMLNAEFAALSYYGDLDECCAVLDELHKTVEWRVKKRAGYPNQSVKLLWLTPPADPLLLNYVEELGGRIVATEYLINQTTPLISIENDKTAQLPSDEHHRSFGRESIFLPLSEAQLSGSLISSSDYRIGLALQYAGKSRANGAVISGVFGSSHCPYETAPLVEALRQAGIPTLAFDVVAPGKVRMQAQLLNRIEAFIEMLKNRKNANIDADADERGRI